MSTDEQKQQASDWFNQIRDQICAGLEAIDADCENEDFAPAKFERTTWKRSQADNDGGTMAVIRGGRVFEKGGVNVSTVQGEFSEEFRAQIPGSEDDGKFWASGMSIVIHPRNPHVPITHMNTRHIVTSGKSWFGGGIDLTPVFPNDGDTEFFHGVLRDCCDAHNSKYYGEYKKWCDDYFFIKHRNEPRGVGGIFYDYLDKNWDRDFAFTQDVGRAFLKAYEPIARKYMNRPWNDEDKRAQLIKRGRYAEFNLIYDRGTQFGLKTGGNTEAILMSLPPEAAWP